MVICGEWLESMREMNLRIDGRLSRLTKTQSLMSKEEKNPVDASGHRGSGESACEWRTGWCALANTEESGESIVINFCLHLSSDVHRFYSYCSTAFAELWCCIDSLDQNSVFVDGDLNHDERKAAVRASLKAHRVHARALGRWG